VSNPNIKERKMNTRRWDIYGSTFLVGLIVSMLLFANISHVNAQELTYDTYISLAFVSENEDGSLNLRYLEERKVENIETCMQSAAQVNFVAENVQNNLVAFCTPFSVAVAKENNETN
jgi:hypothetical protein